MTKQTFSPAVPLYKAGESWRNWRPEKGSDCQKDEELISSFSTVSRYAMLARQAQDNVQSIR